MALVTMQRSVPGYQIVERFGFVYGDGPDVLNVSGALAEQADGLGANYVIAAQFNEIGDEVSATGYAVMLERIG